MHTFKDINKKALFPDMVISQNSHQRKQICTNALYNTHTGQELKKTNCKDIFNSLIAKLLARQLTKNSFQSLK